MGGGAVWKGIQSVGLDQQEVQILSLVGMLQTRVYIVAQRTSSKLQTSHSTEILWFNYTLHFVAY